MRRLPPDEGSAAARRVVTYDFDVITGAIHLDREGNYWFGSSNGLHRFYYTPLIRIELPPTQGGFSLVADGRGAVWVGGDRRR